jgi:hypothetical protein
MNAHTQTQGVFTYESNARRRAAARNQDQSLRSISGVAPDLRRRGGG